MCVKAMSSAQTEDKQIRELVHWNVYPNGCIGRMPANEMKRSGIECALGYKRGAAGL